MSDKYLPIDEAAAYLRLSKETLYKYVQKGLVPAAKIGRHWRFDKDAIDAWITSQTQTAPPQVQASPVHVLSRTGCRMKVLVVDDDAAIRLILEKWIRADNHDVDLAKNGSEAMERLTTATYNLVFLDLQMPDITGGQVLGRLQEYDHHPPVVLITGYSETPLMAQALNYDLLYVLTKPFDRKQVQKLLLSVQATIPFPSSGVSSPPLAHDKHALAPSRAENH